jgi:glycosyltransferase involved in cell wall biosynthesis
MKQEGNVAIRYFESPENYLQEMAASLYTLALPLFNEGWNRVAHESILVGTPVIGYPKGGLADLLKQSNSHMAHHKEDVLHIILNPQELKQFNAPPELHIQDDNMRLEMIKKWTKETKK